MPGFDLAASAHDGWQAEPQVVAGVATVSAGQKGRTLTRLDIVRNDGSGAFTDLGGIGRNVDEKKRLEKQIGDLQAQLASAKPELQANLKLRAQALQKRQEEVEKTLSAGPEPQRSFRSKFFTLDTGVADDPDLKKIADAFAAKYPDVTAPPRPMAPHLPFGKAPLPGKPLITATPVQPRPPPPVIATPAPKPKPLSP